MLSYSQTEEGKLHLAKITQKAADTASYRAWPSEKKQIAYILSGAKQRCTNFYNAGYHNYGARGIQFIFSSIEEAVNYVYDTLGAKPSDEHSIDRIDNNKHYEAGNLRWATRNEQNSNKRQYKNAVPRILYLMTKRPDLSRSTISNLVKLGKPDEEILGWVKYASSRI